MRAKVPATLEPEKTRQPIFKVPRFRATGQHSARGKEVARLGKIQILRPLIGAPEDRSALLNSPFNNRLIKFSATERTFGRQ